MAQIASEDYINKRIYLHLDTVTNGFDPALMQREHRTLRRLNANGERGFDPMVSFVGNEAKGGGKFTPRSTRLRGGVRIVPYDTGVSGEYSLPILNEILNVPDGIADRDVFDRIGVLANVDIDKAYDPVEVIQIVTGSAVTEQDKVDIAAASALDVWGMAMSGGAMGGVGSAGEGLRNMVGIMGAMMGVPVSIKPGSIKIGTVEIEVTGDGETETILTRKT